MNSQTLFIRFIIIFDTMRSDVFYTIYIHVISTEIGSNETFHS